MAGRFFPLNISRQLYALSKHLRKVTTAGRRWQQTDNNFSSECDCYLTVKI